MFDGQTMEICKQNTKIHKQLNTNNYNPDFEKQAHAPGIENHETAEFHEKPAQAVEIGSLLETQIGKFMPKAVDSVENSSKPIENGIPRGMGSC